MLAKWRWLVVAGGFALGICALGWWEMPVAELLLKYIGVLLTWPPVIALILLFFLSSQREAIAKLIDRIAEIVFPGGSLKLPIYEGIGAQTKGEPNDPTPSAQASASPKEQVQQSAQTDEAFRVLIVRGLSTNQGIIAQLLDRIWIRFNSTGSMARRPPESYLDKVKALAQHLDQNAINDLRRIETTLRGGTNKGLIESVYVYVASQQLVWYLTDITVRNRAYGSTG